MWFGCSNVVELFAGNKLHGGKWRADVAAGVVAGRQPRRVAARAPARVARALAAARAARAARAAAAPAGRQLREPVGRRGGSLSASTRPLRRVCSRTTSPQTASCINAVFKWGESCHTVSRNHYPERVVPSMLCFLKTRMHVVAYIIDKTYVLDA